MDMITFSHRSHQGCKYLIVIRDIGSTAIKLIPCVHKDDAMQSLCEWIVGERKLSLYKYGSYDFCAVVKTDNAGEWGLENVEKTCRR